MDRITCRRCEGLMYPVDPLDPLDVIQGGKLDAIRAWRCLTCGDLIDQVIMQNRVRPPRSRRVRQRPSPRHPVFKDPDLEWPAWG
ncbi:MAG: hypothetical protein AB7P24_07720 [Nitrospira sp.]